MRMMTSGEYALPQEVGVTGCELQLVNGPAAETGLDAEKVDAETQNWD